MRRADRLPVCLPNGTKHVIERRHGNIFSEYIELPDGRRVDLSVNGKASGSGAKRAKHRSEASA
jgi:hypothetical protein